MAPDAPEVKEIRDPSEKSRTPMRTAIEAINAPAVRIGKNTLTKRINLTVTKTKVEIVTKISRVSIPIRKSIQESKGGHRQNQQDRKGGGGWKQPLPPRETDHVGGVLPDAARYKKFEDVKAILDELGEIENPVDLSELYELSIDQGRLGAEAPGSGI